MKSVANCIKISCDTKDTLKLSQLTEFQGDLKKRDDTDFDKIVKSIKKYGIAFPLFVWKCGDINYILDGHGRYGALHKLDSLGFLIPPLPVVYVDCKDEQGARDLLLRLNSHYGEMTAESVKDFIGDFDIDLSDIRLPDGVITFESPEIDIDFGDEKIKEPKFREIRCPDCGRIIVIDDKFNVVDEG